MYVSSRINHDTILSIPECFTCKLISKLDSSARRTYRENEVRISPFHHDERNFGSPSSANERSLNQKLTYCRRKSPLTRDCIFQGIFVACDVNKVSDGWGSWLGVAKRLCRAARTSMMVTIKECPQGLEPRSRKYAHGILSQKDHYVATRQWAYRMKLSTPTISSPQGCRLINNRLSYQRVPQRAFDGQKQAQSINT